MVPFSAPDSALEQVSKSSVLDHLVDRQIRRFRNDHADSLGDLITRPRYACPFGVCKHRKQSEACPTVRHHTGGWVARGRVSL